MKITAHLIGYSSSVMVVFWDYTLSLFPFFKLASKGHFPILKVNIAQLTPHRQ